MNYQQQLFQLDLNDYRLMARYTGHMLLMATEYMDEYQLSNMMMNHLTVQFVSGCLDDAGVEYFNWPPMSRSE